MSGKIFFTSDMHFGHKNVIEYDDRPFSTVEEMDETIIKNWNRKVGSEDDVYIIGDVALCGRTAANACLSRLNGKLHLILGNHDYLMKKPESKGRFVEITDEKIILLDGKRLLLRHIPRDYWKDMTDIDYFIYGHIHNNLTSFNQTTRYNPKYLNAGIMLTGYAPVFFEELQKYNYISWVSKRIKKDDDKVLIMRTDAEKLYFNNRYELYIVQDFIYYFSCFVQNKNTFILNDFINSKYAGYESIIKINELALSSLFSSKQSDEITKTISILFDINSTINYAINDCLEEKQGFYLRDDRFFKESKRPSFQAIPFDENAPLSLNLSPIEIKAFQDSIVYFGNLVEAREEKALEALETLFGECSDIDLAKKYIHIIYKYKDNDIRTDGFASFYAAAKEVEGRL